MVSACAALVERCDRPARCALKLLHRVAVDCAMMPLLFQGSLFLVFQRALRGAGTHACPARKVRALSRAGRVFHNINANIYRVQKQ